ncbi:MAG: SpoIVB peptidase S55 domain-containing protein [Acidobacteriota bacterium]
MRRLTPAVAMLVTITAAAVLGASPAQDSKYFPIDDVRPGMVATGRTVFAGDTLEEFRVNIVGVLRNVMGPRRDLILAKLEGGPLANTGVIQGMSGSPVYIDGRLLGAVSYSIGSFPKEPLAGITPIAEMMAAVDTGGTGRGRTATAAFTWPATSSEVFATLSRMAGHVGAALGSVPRDVGVLGPAGLLDLAPSLRPIDAAIVLNGFDPGIDRDLRQSLAPNGAAPPATGRGEGADATTALRPGDPVGVSLVRGDLEMGATGTVTHVEGARVYAFGHPFLNLGPTTFPMTRAHVYTVLPSLDSSMKIATLGAVIGTMNQDRATAVGGTLGPGPRELAVHISLLSEGAPARQFTFQVIEDETLTPLFTYVSVLNALVAYGRQAGATSVAARGTLSFGANGQVTIDDVFSGDTATTSAAAAIVAPIGAAVANPFRVVTAERLDLELTTSERETGSSIERAWLDTTQPRFGATHTLQVQLRDYRGQRRVITMPVSMPSHADGPLTLLVSDAPTLSSLEDKELTPAKPHSWADVLSDLGRTRRNNRLYVRLIASSGGTVVAGETLTALPASARSILDADPAIAHTSVTRTVVGSWEQRMDVVVHGSRELTLTLTSRQ